MMSANRRARIRPASVRVLMVCATAICAVSAADTSPRLLATPGLQGPTHAAGDDLLLLAGASLTAEDRVIYRDALLAGPDWPRDCALPDESTEFGGQAEVIHEASDDRGLVVRLPATFDGARAYLLAVRNHSGEWSNAVRINDARAYWFSPAALPARGQAPGLGRRLRVVGANLAGGNQPLHARLSGPVTRLLQVHASEARLRDHVAEFDIPELPAGRYRIGLSRDGRSWSEADKLLELQPAGGAREEFPVSAPRFGGCRPDDGEDDTHCVVAALSAAGPVRGVLRFAPGTWRLDAPGTSGVSKEEGLRVPLGVDLEGDPHDQTRLLRGAQWSAGQPRPTFTLLGQSLIRQLSFVDSAAPHRDAGETTFLQLGSAWWSREGERVVSGISVVDNDFSGADVAIRDRGRALRQLVITGNRFRARKLALSLGGDGNNLEETFRIEDAVIRANVFEPGSYLDTMLRQGARAAEFGAGERFDFSGNRADGASISGLDRPEHARGWRAAFFWHLRGPQEQLLIAGNEMSCTGDKAGDGEAIALDNNHNRAGFAAPRDVVAADAVSVSVRGELRAGHEQRAVARDYYFGHWLQIAEGTGLGQGRRITSIHRDPVTGLTVLRVTPAWDVVPRPGASRITLARTFWRTFILGNEIDSRSPPCLKSNRTEPESGAIALWAQSTDTIVANNRQWDSDGIVFHQTHAPGMTSFNYFLEIRGNEILGEYEPRRTASESGIRGPHGAAPGIAPPVTGFGVSIAHNRIHAADTAGAAINVDLSWHAGPAPHRWPLIERLLIFGNRISGTRTGIALPARAQLRRAVLHGNHCDDARQAVDAGDFAVLVCGSRPGTCGCGSR